MGQHNFTNTMDAEFRFPPTRPRAATPFGVWFDSDSPSGARGEQADDTPLPRTRLVQDRTTRSDDLQVMQLLDGLPPVRSLELPGYAVAILNESGQVYREVWLWGMGEALVFTARMNSSGFAQVAPPVTTSHYDSVFTRR